MFNHFDYQDVDQTNLIKELNNEVSKLKYVQPPVYSWFASFNNFISQDKVWIDACGARGVDKLPYSEQLKKFLEVSITSTCCQDYGICGEQYITDLRFDNDG